MTNEEFKENMKYSEKYREKAHEIFRNVFEEYVMVDSGTRIQDLKQATDDVVYLSEIDLGRRTRRPGVFEEYGDVTIRVENRVGTASERDKILDGFTDYWFYSWADGEGGFAHWDILNSEKLRESEMLLNPEIIHVKDDNDFASLPLIELREKGVIHREMNSRPRRCPKCGNEWEGIPGDKCFFCRVEGEDCSSTLSDRW